MTRLNVIVEGKTERDFVDRTLAPHLRTNEIYARPILVSASSLRRSQDHLGGGGSFGKALRIIRNTLQNDSSAYCTTMFDYYGLPTDYPGVDSEECPPSARLYERIDFLEKCLAHEVGDTHRFLPYLQVHEFEALLFTDVEVINRAPGLQSTAGSRLDDLRSIIDHFETPERIDDGEETAPSKRLQDLFPHCNKVVHGEMIAYDIGLSRIRAECPHFNDWVNQLESLESLGT